MLRPGSLPGELLRRPFTVAEALDRGVSRRVLDNSALRRPFAGERVPVGLPDDLRTLCRSAALVLPRHAALSHTTAAALLDLPLPRRLTGRDPVEASVPTGSVVPRIAGARVVEGLDPLAGLAGRRDVVRLRGLLPLTRYPVRSSMETLWRLLIIDAGIPEPRYDEPVFDRHGGWLATPDDQWPEVRVATEYEGLHHFEDARQWRRDIFRKELMEDEDWRVLRITRDDVLARPRRAIDRLWCVLDERGLPGLPPRP